MFGVELVPPRFEDHSGVIDAPELGRVQAFIAEAIVERLGVAVLPGFARLDVVGRRSLGFEPLGQLEGDEFGSVVAPDDGRSSSKSEEPGQNPFHRGRRERSGRHNGESFSRELVDDGKHLHAATTDAWRRT